LARHDSHGFVVLGGAGTIGRVVVRDLLWSDRHNRVICADVDGQKASSVVASLASARVSAAAADVRRPATLVPLLRGHAVVINCTQHSHNLQVMRAALTAGIHYVDLGGLFTWTRRQLALTDRFARVGLLAVPGMGCAPGITNVLARLAVDRLGAVERLEIRVASRDRGLPVGSFVFGYSPRTIVEELTLRPWIFSRRRFRTVPPRSGWELVPFSRPVGPSWVVRTRHSEIATLPLSFRERGLATCDFKVGFDRAFVRTLMRRLRSGASLARLAAEGRRTATPDDHEISRVIAISPRRRGRRRIVIVDCHANARPEWEAGAGDVDTAVPASVVAQMIAGGHIRARGVIPPELVVPMEPFLKELRRRGLRIIVHSRRRT
jgi:saccharopine dehydrogenase-like NADP-dependent oxidoreductase